MSSRHWTQHFPGGRRGGAALLTGALLLLGSAAVYAAPGLLAAPKELNPCAAKTLNPCAAKTLNPCAAKTPGDSASLAGSAQVAADGNPCGGKNPCNPCGAKNPCGMKNPCNPCGGGASVDASRFKQPAGAKLASSSGGDLVAQGEKLWNDRTLGKSGLACANCHIGNYLQMQPTFAQPYPHYVAMPAQQGGVDEVSAAEMVQFCMIVPMAAEPLPWDSVELASLAAYVEHIRPDYAPVPGAPMTGAGANPCNPCAGANPCNPKQNPCNPCSGSR